jgi:outer membrane receptor protein involved in Fe transport
MKFHYSGLLCTIVSVSCFALQASAQEKPASGEVSQTLEEVIVTAERRSTDIQKTAASVSVRTGEELAAQGRYTTRQILEDIPGLTAVDNSSLNVGGADVQGNNITIRGITPGVAAAGAAPTGISTTPGTAVYVDGVYEGIGSGYDIERVELLRGPQGTLYGRSATSGVVAFHTRNPNLEKVEGNAGVEFGNYDLQHYTAAVNVPVSQTLAIRVSGDYRDQGKGYFNDATRGLDKATNGRAKLYWKPTDAFSLLVGVAYAKDEAFSGGSARTAAVPSLALTTTTSGIFPGLKIQRQIWAEANWDVGPVTLTYLPAHRSWYQNDNRQTDPNFIGSGFPLFQLIKTPKDSFDTHELRVASKEGSAVQWQAGAFSYHNALDNTNHNALRNPDGTDKVVQTEAHDNKDTKSLGVFAEATFPVGSAARVTLGARYDDTKVQVTEFFYANPYSTCGTVVQGLVPLPPGATCTGVGVGNPPASVATNGVTINGVQVNFHNFNYKARLEYDLTAKNMVYGMISTGFRPGDARVANQALNIVAAEKLTSIELGSKNRFLDDTLQVNAGVYHYNYQGFPTSYIPDTPSPADYANFARGSIGIVVPAHLFGGELEVLYQVTPHDRIGFNGNYSESRWYDKPAAFAAAQTETKRALTPYTMNANYEHAFSLAGGSTLTARIDGRYEASHLSTNLHVDYLRIGFDQYMRVGARTIGNLSATWASNGGRYSLTGYVRNFADVKYTAYTTTAGPTSLNAIFSDPRTYGVQGAVHF